MQGCAILLVDHFRHNVTVALYHAHHGMTNGVFMPYVLVFNSSAIETKIDRLAAYLGISGGFEGFLKAVLDLRQKTGVPHTLAGLKVDGSRREQMAEMAIVDPTAGSNPVTLTKDGALRIFDMALAGSLELSN